MDELQAYTINPSTLVDALEAGIVVHGADTAIRYANPKALELLHLSADQARGMLALDPYWTFVDADRRPLSVDAYPVSRVIKRKMTVRDQIVGIINTSGGRTTWVNVCAYPEYDARKNIANVIVTFVDVTHRVRSERLRKAQLDIALRSNELSEQRLLQLVLSWCETITGSTISFFHFVNDDQETIELITWSERTLAQYCHVEELNRHYPISEAGVWAEAFRSKRPVVINDYAQAANRRGLPDGHAHLERFVSMPLLEGDMVRVLLGVGNKAYAYTNDDVQDLTIVTDQVWRIVKQRRTEAKARELAHAVEQTRAMIVMTNENGVIRYVNPAFEDITGYGWDDVEGRTLSFFKSSETQESVFRDMWMTLEAGGTWVHRLKNKGKHGKAYCINIVISPMKNVEGQMMGFLGVGEDVTEQAKLEEQLHQAQKMEVIGQLTGGIAHDFNNYLAIIAGNLQLLDEDMAQSGGACHQRELIADALWSAERGAELTAGLLAFARRQTLHPAETDINAVVRSVTQLLRRTLGERIEIETDLKHDLWKAMVDRGHLETALVNLGVNARDAMGEGGTLRIATDNARLAARQIRAGSEAVPGAYVTLAVTDTGTGMTGEVRDRIFEPFFTTKRFGSGSGLGLSMVYGFVRQSGGHITVQSEVGAGTTITLYLPRAAASAAAGRETVCDAPMRAVGDEVVLVVEDDDRVRRTVVTTLRRQGYQVIEASRAAEALSAVDRAPRLDLIFIDVALAEGLDGRELAKVTHDRRPATRVLLTSGYAQSAVGGNGRLDGFRLLTKPYRRGELARAVRDVLDEPTA